jgi:hypothetical protein
MAFELHLLRFEGGDDVIEAQEVQVHLFELLEGFLALGFVFRNTTRFFKNEAPLGRVCREDLVNLALNQEGVSHPPNPCIHEEHLDVLEPARFPVEEIIAPAVPCHTPFHFDFMESRTQLVFAIRKGERHFADLGGPAQVCAFKNDVLHLATAQGFRTLFAEDPAERIHNVAFAAAIRPNDTRHPWSQLNPSGVGKAFEACDGDFFKKHADNAAQPYIDNEGLDFFQSQIERGFFYNYIAHFFLKNTSHCVYSKKEPIYFPKNLTVCVFSCYKVYYTRNCIPLWDGRTSLQSSLGAMGT